MEDEVKQKPMDGSRGESTEERLTLRHEVRQLSCTESDRLNMLFVYSDHINEFMT